jgi:uncharacterized SAM-binding protein YcdF (DUF218 family)
MDYAIVFGAGVRPDGQPSPVLRHRIEGALAWGRGRDAAMFLATGGQGRHGPPEAEVIRDALIAGGIDPALILVEAKARDTLESVRFCDRILRERGDCRRVIVCTSTYHQSRCALLLRLLGYRVVAPEVPNGWGKLKVRRYGVALLKEAIAAPYDAGLLLLRRAASAVLRNPRIR